MWLPRIPAGRAASVLEEGLALDLRPIPQYLEKHLRGSISILWEQGPGFATRARDLLPLNARLILLEDESSPLQEAASRLRGKGFDVEGYLSAEDLGQLGKLIPTRSVPIEDAGSLHLLHVGDPGTVHEGRSVRIPAERLWDGLSELNTSYRIGVLSGFGVRAATAVGILEKFGFKEIVLIRTRSEGAKPRVAGPEVFRVGGPG